jgi:membrane-associated phospholipid phosphatase
MNPSSSADSFQVVIILMLIQRLVFKNHTITQLIIGGIIGILFAYMVVIIKNKINKYIFNNNIDNEIENAVTVE